uniref:Uncharacterized protein n=2 Tax=Acrobeloides nanus TaxID=290746 RepID=A0A914CGI2_9BILA
MTLFLKHLFVILEFLIVIQMSDSLPLKKAAQKRLNFNFMRSWLPLEQPYVTQHRKKELADNTEPITFPPPEQETTTVMLDIVPISPTRHQEIVNRLMCIQALGLAAACNMYI